MRFVAFVILCSPALGGDGQVLLDRISSRVHANIRNMPRYTCEEAIERSWFNGKALERSDRIRLDVAVGSTGEMFAWHGARSFQTGDIDELIKNGPISSGTFSSFLVNIFTPGAAQVKFNGEGKFVYSMPLKHSTFLVGNASKRILTSYGGSFSADPATGRLSGMQIRSESLPTESFMSSLDMQVSYASAHLGDADVELPSTVAMDLTDLRHERTRSVTTYRNCHQFLGESVLRFDDDSTPEQAAAKAEQKPFAMPEGRSMTIRVLSDIEPGTAWAGDRIEGLLTSNVAGILEKGTRMLGHLVRVETLEGRRTSYNVDFVFDEIVISGVAHAVRLEALTGPPQFQRDRNQLTVMDGPRTSACRFRLTYKTENLRNAITHWRS